MSKQTISNLTGTLKLTTAAFLVLLLGVIYPAAISRVNAQTPSKANASSPAGGPKEGIKVHGHWTIDVRNPDGTLVTHREFENALRPGSIALASFLGRVKTPGYWVISLVNTTGSGQPCITPSGGHSVCSIGDSSPLVSGSTLARS